MGKESNGDCCYFTDKDSRLKFKLTVYRRQKDEQYMIDESKIDFKVCAVNTAYLITVILNRKHKAVLKNACLV